MSNLTLECRMGLGFLNGLFPRVHTGLKSNRSFFAVAVRTIGLVVFVRFISIRGSLELHLQASTLCKFCCCFDRRGVKEIGILLAA